jgi:two-component system response regulator (stage 0 sporulation protein A)
MENTVVVVEENKCLREKLEEYFSKNNQIKLIGSSDNGLDGFELIKQKQPTISLIDLILPGIDGFEVLEKIKSSDINTKAVVLSSFSEEGMVKNAIDKGASYYIVKPFSFETLTKRLLEIFDIDTEKKISQERKRNNSLEEKISNIFITVGIPPHIKGYSYLREGVKMAIKSPAIINNITKQLYPMIGEKYETTASKVERAIRHAIEVAWNRGRIESINTIFGVRAYVGSEKPTNGEFIALVADKLLLEWA